MREPLICTKCGKEEKHVLYEGKTCRSCFKGETPLFAQMQYEEYKERQKAKKAIRDRNRRNKKLKGK